MTVLFVLVGLAVVLGVGLLAVGRLGSLPDVEPDRAPDLLPDDRPLDAAAVEGVRFDVGVRGYRMDEVDDLLDRVAADLATRDARIDALRTRLVEAGVPEPDGQAPDEGPSDATDGAGLADGVTGPDPDEAEDAGRR